MLSLQAKRLTAFCKLQTWVFYSLNFFRSCSFLLQNKLRLKAIRDISVNENHFLNESVYFCRTAHTTVIKRRMRQPSEGQEEILLYNSITTFRKLWKSDWSYLKKADLRFGQNCSQRVFSFGDKVAFLHMSEY